MSHYAAPDERERLLHRARAGDAGALGELLELHRGYFKVLAGRWLPAKVRARMSASDAVQQTFLLAHQDIHQFTGGGPAEFAGWLERILERAIQQAVRGQVYAQKRAVGRERSLGETADYHDPAADLVASDSSPSQRTMRGEQAIRLAQCLEQLPEGQREAVRLRYLEGWPLQEISEALGKSPQATAGLLKRGLHALRHLMRT